MPTDTRVVALPTTRTKPKHRSRLRHFRKQANLTQSELADLIGSTQSKIGAIERGQRQLKRQDAERLAALPVMQCTVAELYEDDGHASVPLVWVVALNGTERPNLPPRVPASFLLERPEDCAAAYLADDSADLLRRPGSLLYCRLVEEIEAELAPGLPVLVSRRAVDNGPVILVGLLDVAASGDLVLLTQSTNPILPASVLIQPARRAHERRLLMPVPRPHRLSYTSRPDDPARVLAVVERADEALI